MPPEIEQPGEQVSPWYVCVCIYMCVYTYINIYVYIYMYIFSNCVTVGFMVRNKIQSKLVDLAKDEMHL